jgi:DNA-binding FrmR family transcriptional regulator
MQMPAMTEDTPPPPAPDRERAALLARLRRIEGQVRGLQRMVQQDRPCSEVLVQLAAVRAALAAVGQRLVERHARTCLRRAMADGRGEAAMAELVEALRRWV